MIYDLCARNLVLQISHPLHSFSLAGSGISGETCRIPFRPFPLNFGRWSDLFVPGVRPGRYGDHEPRQVQGADSADGGPGGAERKGANDAQFMLVFNGFKEVVSGRLHPVQGDAYILG